MVTDDGVELVGTMHEPDTLDPFPCVVALHAAAFGTREHPLYQHLVETLTRAGMGVCLYDRRGVGASGGNPGTPLERLADDGRHIADALRGLATVDVGRVGVWGVSQGGWIGPMAAAADDRFAFVIAVSASGVSPSEQMRFAVENVLSERGFTDADVGVALQTRTRIESAYRAGETAAARAAVEAVHDEAWFPFAYLPTVEDIEHPDPFEIDLDARAVFARLRVPTLAIYGAWDRWVPVDRSVDAWRTAFAARPNLLHVARIPGVGHMMTTPIDRADLDEKGPISDIYAEVMTGWLTELLG